MRLATDLLGSPSDLLRLLARTKRFTLRFWDLVWIQWLTVNFSHLHNDTLEIAPDHSSGEGLAKADFGFTQTSGPDQPP